MKKLFLAMLLTVTGHLLFDMYHAQCLAGSVQASATTRLLSDLRNPTEGTLALEQDGVRLSLSLGTQSRLSGALDMLARTSGGTYVGAGLVVDRLDDSSYNSTSSSDTTVVTRPHDHGRHLGDHHVRHGRTVTSTSSALSVLSVGGTDLALTPSLSIGMAARHGLFLESRVLFSGGDASNRTSVGVRF